MGKAHFAHALPVVFAVVSDPVGSGFDQNLARPGGNATGFINIESSVASKWLEILKQIAPRISRVSRLPQDRGGRRSGRNLNDLGPRIDEISCTSLHLIQVDAAPAQIDLQILVDAMVGGVSGVTGNIVPFGFAKGQIAALAGLNVVGLRRRGASVQSEYRASIGLLTAKEIEC